MWYRCIAIPTDGGRREEERPIPPPFPPSFLFPKSGHSAQDDWEGGWSVDDYDGLPSQCLV